MLKNRPPSNHFASPSKVTAFLKGQYKRIADRVRDDPILCGLSIPLPNINSKSISNFFTREEKKANYRATVMPKDKPHQTVLSDQLLPEAPALPSSLPSPDRPSHQPIRPKPAAAASNVPPAVSAAPVLLVVPAQPQAPSIRFTGPSCSHVFVPVVPPPAPTVKPIMPKKSQRPCGACLVSQCGGQRKRYTPSKEEASGSSQKIFTFCPATNKSTTSGFKGVVYNSFEHFKSVVDKELEKRKNN